MSNTFLTIVHDPSAPAPTDGNWGSNKNHPLWGKGLVIALFARTWEFKGFDDYRYGTALDAIIWNPVKGRAEITNLKTNENHGGSTFSTPWQVDATPYVMAQFTEWMRKEFVPKYATETANAEVMAAQTKANFAFSEFWKSVSRINRNDTVTVVSGRKYAHGLTGKMFWSGRDNYGNQKLGVALSDRKDSQGRNMDVMWIAQSNVEKVQSGQVKEQLSNMQAEIETYNSDSYKISIVAMRQAEVSAMSDEQLMDMMRSGLGNRYLTSSHSEHMEADYGGTWN